MSNLMTQAMIVDKYGFRVGVEKLAEILCITKQAHRAPSMELLAASISDKTQIVLNALEGKQTPCLYHHTSQSAIVQPALSWQAVF